MLESGDRQGVAIALGNMIRLYTGLGQYPMAETVARRSLALGRALNIPLYLCEYLYDTAELYARQERFAEAQMANNEALTIATQIERADIGFAAEVAGIRLKASLGQIELPAAIRELEALRAGHIEPREAAALEYAIWQLDPARLAERQSAASLYQRLYGEAPEIEIRERYEALTGERLPEPEALPELPGWVTNAPFDLDASLVQVDKLIGVSRSTRLPPAAAQTPT
jgi:tetratricopeptide (TPR) repeat protein